MEKKSAAESLHVEHLEHVSIKTAEIEERWKFLMSNTSVQDHHTLESVYQQIHPSYGMTSSPAVWAHPAWDSFRLAEQQRESQLELLEAKKAEEVAVGAFTCRKCKGQRIRYTELQMRSGDEGMTRFFRCHTCQHFWRQT